ncbi:hypothetical protein TVAG_104690 [Trichomonas vaginalis G3]|uniref:Glycosyltransferase 61 catalytic domain-containing protein n=1 Tax=Trichomonas vaginalis (strain ATCC PRA-98 / G3) TaxID=412133 RepID=A2FNU3_TRIV3|nr:glycosyltransferase family [Trichomonas vaginalis G3]EAX93424.1 hypothetical protein TVAG_104690 [Trichomonas vaginalis G3]KAI5506163.1 glycosyltransferase family [Trichomonas vaginalis G3]|eukprot:XP_001306354.1 hypothetical protein [Trichomonas vaginalis G3]
MLIILATLAIKPLFARIRIDLFEVRRFAYIKYRYGLYTKFYSYETILTLDNKSTTYEPNHLLLYGENTKINRNNKAAFTSNSDDMNQLKRHTGKIVRFKGVYVSGINTIVDRYGVLMKKKDRNHYYRYGACHGPVLNHYTDVIGIGFVEIDVYGHFIMDVMSPMLCIPLDIRKRSVVVLTPGSMKYSHLLRIIGIEGPIIALERDQYVFATNLYTCWDPRAHGGWSGPPLYRLSRVFQEHCNVTNAVPKYVGFHKRTDGRRIVSNIFDIMEIAKTKYPKEEIIKIPDSFDSFEAAGKFWSELKIVVSAAGSNLMNVMFMRPEQCVIQNGCSDLFNYAITLEIYVFQQFQIILTSPKMRHYVWESGVVNQTEALEALDIAFYAIKNKKFPHIDVFHYLR